PTTPPTGSASSPSKVMRIGSPMPTTCSGPRSADPSSVAGLGDSLLGGVAQAVAQRLRLIEGDGVVAVGNVHGVDPRRDLHRPVELAAVACTAGHLFHAGQRRDRDLVALALFEVRNETEFGGLVAGLRELGVL